METATNLIELTQDQKSGEYLLWMDHLQNIVGDAVYPFQIPDQRLNRYGDVNAGTIHEQYLDLVSSAERGKGLPQRNTQQKRDRRSALRFLETESFDDLSDQLGLGYVFVTKTCELVQEALTLGKKMYLIEDELLASRGATYSKAAA